jgi:hypothetical protein
VALPLASRLGPVGAGAAFVTTLVTAERSAAALPGRRGEAVAAASNGFMAAAVTAHFTSWPRTSRAGLPWLVECEGMSGPVMGPYNVILNLNTLAAAAGLVETRRGLPWSIAVFALSLPALKRFTMPEFENLLRQAHGRPRWWNRRLAKLT